jgi:hypothetical protein
MSRFYERYALTIVWIITTLFGIGLAYWALVGLARLGLPALSAFNDLVVHADEIIRERAGAFVSLIAAHIQWIGAFGTLGSFVFGLVTGIRYAKRQLPNRLIEFMQEQMPPVYDNTEALVAAVVNRSAVALRREPLYLKQKLQNALDAMGERRPRSAQSLEGVINEAASHIDVTATRLQYLRELRAHARLLRGAVRGCDPLTRSDFVQTAADVEIEDDFTAAIENKATSMAGLELRGLLRSRCLADLKGALEDFNDLEKQAKASSSVRGQARALRLQAEVLLRQGESGERGRKQALQDARRRLIQAFGRLDDNRTLDDAHWYERGQNREAYGLVQSAFGRDHLARRAFNAALACYRQSNLATEADRQRINQRLGGPQQQRRPSIVCRLALWLCGPQPDSAR